MYLSMSVNFSERQKSSQLGLELALEVWKLLIAEHVHFPRKNSLEKRVSQGALRSARAPWLRSMTDAFINVSSPALYRHSEAAR